MSDLAAALLTLAILTYLAEGAARGLEAACWTRHAVLATAVLLAVALTVQTLELPTPDVTATASSESVYTNRSIDY